MLLDIALQWAFNSVDQFNNKIYENWYATNIDETTVSINVPLKLWDWECLYVVGKQSKDNGGMGGGNWR